MKKIKVIIKRDDELVGHITNISVSKTAMLRRFPFGFIIIHPVNTNFMVLQDVRKEHVYKVNNIEDVVLTYMDVDPAIAFCDYLDMCGLTEPVIEEYKKACHDIELFGYCKIYGPYFVK